MKRDSDTVDDIPTSGENMKRSRTENKFELRILIASKIAGSIIGKGGSNIQKLRNNNNANVRVPNCEGPERVMNIQVDNEKALVNVIQQSLPYMAEDMAKSPPGATIVPNAGPNEIRLLIHQSIVGGIIGKGGSKIKEIREKSGANIKVYGTCAPQSSDRCVVIQGTNEKICAALEQIIQLIYSTEIKGANQPYDPYNFDGFYAHEYGGYGSERDVGDFNNMPRGGPRNRGNYGSQGRSNFGNPGDINVGFNAGMDKFGSLHSESNLHLVSTADSGPTQTTKVTIPKDMGGAIIGPGGSRIRKIRLDSNADIKIAEAEQGTEERIITISGTERNIQMAQYLLQQCVKEFSNP